MGWEVGVGVLNGGGNRVGVMLLGGKSFQISAKKGGWVGVANGPKDFFTVGSVIFSGLPLDVQRKFYTF